MTQQARARGQVWGHLDGLGAPGLGAPGSRVPAHVGSYRLWAAVATVDGSGVGGGQGHSERALVEPEDPECLHLGGVWGPTSWVFQVSAKIEDRVVTVPQTVCHL